MNKVYSRVFLSALGSRLLGYSLFVHVSTLDDGDEISSSAGLIVCTVSNLALWGGRE